MQAPQQNVIRFQRRQEQDRRAALHCLSGAIASLEKLQTEIDATLDDLHEQVVALNREAEPHDAVVTRATFGARSTSDASS